MKTAFGIALMILALAVYADAFGLWKGGCRTDADCEETQCCVKQKIGSDLGQCLRRPLEGELCIKENKFSKMFQQGSCPCTEGLICSRVSNVYTGIGYAFPPVCMVKPETTAAEEEANKPEA